MVLSKTFLIVFVIVMTIDPKILEDYWWWRQSNPDGTKGPWCRCRAEKAAEMVDDLEINPKYPGYYWEVRLGNVLDVLDSGNLFCPQHHPELLRLYDYFHCRFDNLEKSIDFDKIVIL